MHVFALAVLLALLPTSDVSRTFRCYHGSDAVIAAIEPLSFIRGYFTYLKSKSFFDS